MNRPVLSWRDPHPAPTPPVRAEGASALTAEIVDLDWLQGHAAAWDGLAAAAAYANPHFSRQVVSAHAAQGLAGDLRAVVVRRGGDWRALLPFRPAGARVGWRRRAHGPFVSPYVTDATPLIAPGDLDASAEALADGMALAAGPGLWRLPLLASESAAGRALTCAFERRGWAVATLSSFPRAVLGREGVAGPPKRCKDLRRRRRRLAERGHVESLTVAGGPALDAAVEAFLALEARGWKGRRGTAMALRPTTAGLARRLFRHAPGAPVQPRVDMLTLDGRPIAVSLALLCGGTACLLKTAYDEAFRPYAPGILLEEDIIAALRATAFADRLDSASLPGSVLESLYPHRETIADLLVAVGGRVDAADLAALARAERLRRGLLDRLKSARDALRGRG